MQPEKPDGDYVMGSIRSQSQCTMRNLSNGRGCEVVIWTRTCAGWEDGHFREAEAEEPFERME